MWRGMGFQNVFGDTPTKWTISKKQKQTQQNICALGASQLINIDLQEDMVIKGI
jgi:hypothetical protein